MSVNCNATSMETSPSVRITRSKATIKATNLDSDEG